MPKIAPAACASATMLFTAIAEDALMNDTPDPITLSQAREHLYSAVVCDALDTLGYTHQSPRARLTNFTADAPLVGRARTTLWADMAHRDPNPYDLELRAVDSCEPDDIFIAAAGGSLRSGIWGELLTTAAQNRGCIGAIIDGAVRDIKQIKAMNFPLLARGVCLYDSKDRQRVIDRDVAVEIDGVVFAPGDLVIADDDGVVVVPQSVEQRVLALAWGKVHAENQVRDAIRGGMRAVEAYERYGVL